MKLVIQRVSSASVTVDKKVVGRISKGYFVLLGVSGGDNEGIAEKLAEKLIKLRVMSDENDKMNLDLKTAGGEVLIVSQFTLYADTSGGNRPSFIKAGEPAKAKAIYDLFISRLREEGLKVATGEFGSYMDIKANLDGPVTIILEQ